MVCERELNQTWSEEGHTGEVEASDDEGAWVL